MDSFVSSDLRNENGERDWMVPTVFIVRDHLLLDWAVLGVVVVAIVESRDVMVLALCYESDCRRQLSSQLYAPDAVHEMYTAESLDTLETVVLGVCLLVGCCGRLFLFYRFHRGVFICVIVVVVVSECREMKSPVS